MHALDTKECNVHNERILILSQQLIYHQEKERLQGIKQYMQRNQNNAPRPRGRYDSLTSPWLFEEIVWNQVDGKKMKYGCIYSYSQPPWFPVETFFENL